MDRDVILGQLGGDGEQVGSWRISCRSIFGLGAFLFHLGMDELVV